MCYKFCIFDMRNKNFPEHRRKVNFGGIDYQKYNDEGAKFC
mgnify:CR=1 FL=1